MDVDPEQHMVVMAPASTWIRQAQEGMKRIREKNGGEDPPKFIDSVRIDFAAFASVVEALVALEPLTGRKVGRDLIDAAGLKPVDQVI